MKKSQFQTPVRSWDIAVTLFEKRLFLRENDFKAAEYNSIFVSGLLQNVKLKSLGSTIMREKSEAKLYSVREI